MLAPLLSWIERERIDRIKLFLSSHMLLLFLLGITALLRFVGSVHLSMKLKLTWRLQQLERSWIWE